MIKIRRAGIDDAEGIYEVYISSSSVYFHSLTQHTNEIKMSYIKNEVIQNSLDLGLILVAENDNGKIIGSFNLIHFHIKLYLM